MENTVHEIQDIDDELRDLNINYWKYRILMGFDYDYFATLDICDKYRGLFDIIDNAADTQKVSAVIETEVSEDRGSLDHFILLRDREGNEEQNAYDHFKEKEMSLLGRLEEAGPGEHISYDASNYYKESVRSLISEIDNEILALYNRTQNGEVNVEFVKRRYEDLRAEILLLC